MALNKQYFTRMSPELANVLEMAKKKYETDFLDLYQALAGRHKQGEARNQVELAKSGVVKTIKSIERLLNFSEETTPQKIAELDKAMDQVESDFKEFTNALSFDPKDQEFLDRLLEKRGLGLKKLSEQQKVFRSRMKKLQKSPTSFGNVWNDTPAFVQSLAKSTLSSVLGPFGGLAEAAFGATGQILAKRNDKQSILERENFVASTLTERDPSHKTFASNLNVLNSAASIPTFAQSYSNTPPSTKMGNIAGMAANLVGMGMPKGSPGFLSPAMSDPIGTLLSGLKLFFNSGYKSAKWTRDIYDALVNPKSKKNETGEVRRINPFEAIVNSLKGVGNLFKSVSSLLMGAVAGLKGLLGPLGKLTQKAAGAVEKVASKVGGLLTTPVAGTVIGASAIGVAGLLGGMLNTAWTDEAVANSKLADATDAQAFQEFLKVNNMNRKKKGLPPVGIRPTDSKIESGISSSSILETSDKGTPTGGNLTSPVIDLEPIIIRKSFPSGERTQPGSPKTESIPLDTTDTENEQKTVEQLSKINQNLLEIKEGTKKSQTSSTTVRSGYDAYNLRDPLLAALNSGTLDLA